jgi:hypothetical protein
MAQADDLLDAFHWEPRRQRVPEFLPQQW